MLNKPNHAGQYAGKKELFGEFNRYAVYPVHTRFDDVQWFVTDALDTDDKTGLPKVIRQGASKEEVVKGLGE